jgi:hypothetical protein
MLLSIQSMHARHLQKKPRVLRGFRESNAGATHLSSTVSFGAILLLGELPLLGGFLRSFLFLLLGVLSFHGDVSGLS